MNDSYRLARIVIRLAKSETERSNVGGVVCVHLRLLDEAAKTAARILATKR